MRPFPVALSALVLSCSVGVAQTAVLDTRVAFAPDCSAAAAPAAPSSGAFRASDTVLPSSLVLASYGAEAGPGIYLLGRDGFRLYLNGSLIAASTAPRTPTFIPLTLLPGDNALAIVVSTQQGTPAVLVQVDELERSYFSDASWKVSTQPAGDWASNTYDDSAWAAATDFGALGTLPGCDPGATFPASSSAHWIGPSEPARDAVLRTVIHIRPSGFGASARGGEGAAPVLVSSQTELSAALEDNDDPAVVLLPEGLLDLRPSGAAVVQQLTCPTPCAGSTKILYTVLLANATCPVPLVNRPRNDRRIQVASNKTIIGLGRGALLRGASFDLGASQNVILRNLAIFDVNPTMIEAGDAISLLQPSNVWVDHCTFKWISDGFTDASAGTKGVTISWSHYDGLSDDACSGHHPRASQFVDAIGTIHHNFWDHVDTHAPTVSHATARVHFYDNYTTDDADYAVEASCGAQVLLEGNTFENVLYPTSKTTCADAPTAGLGSLRAPPGSNLYRDNVGAHRSAGAHAPEPEDPVFAPPYTYTVDPPASAWLTVLTRARAGGPWALPLSLD